MKETYITLKNYVLNGAFSYALFVLYSLTVSPIITRFIDYGEENYFVSIFGFVVLIAEFFALNFKLTMVKFRTEEKRIAYKKETGFDIVPTITPLVFFAFFMRIVFRMIVVMVSMTALGYVCTEKAMSPQGEVALMIVVILDLLGLTYMYFSSDFYNIPPQNDDELQDTLKEENDWLKANKKLALSEKYFRLEIFSDIVLQVYALMIYTAFWTYINQIGFEKLHESIVINDSAFFAALSIFPRLIILLILGLMPIRIAYWMEDSMEAFTTKEESGMWLAFFIVGLFTCSPTIVKFISFFILHQSELPLQVPEYVGYLVSIAFFLLLLAVQIFVYGRRKKNAKWNA